MAAISTAEKVKSAMDECGLKEVDTIVCAAGAWSGGGLGNTAGLSAVDRCATLKNIIVGLFNSFLLLLAFSSMWQANIVSAVSAAHLASRFLAPGGLLVLTGAGAALGPTPSMVGYGIAKAGTHHLARSDVGHRFP